MLRRKNSGFLMMIRGLDSSEFCDFDPFTFDCNYRMHHIVSIKARAMDVSSDE